MKWKFDLSLPVIVSSSRGSGQPLVLLHAFPLTHAIWKEITPPDQYQLILPDFPGFGLSPLPQTQISLSDASQGLNNHMAEKGIEGPVTIGGISMGGYWALEFIRQYPEKVRALILISTRAGIDKPEIKQKRLETAKKVEKEGIGFLAQTMVPGLLGKSTVEKQPGLILQVKQWIQGSLLCGKWIYLQVALLLQIILKGY